MNGMNRAAEFVRVKYANVTKSTTAFVEARKQNARKAQRIGRKIMHYLKTDFKEIAWPSSLPNPPGRPRRQKFFCKETLSEAWTIYRRSWTSDIELFGVVIESKFKKKKPAPSRGTTPQHEKFPSIMEEIAEAAKLGGEHVKPALQRIYMTRATVYRDAVRSFVEGYKQGIRESTETSKTKSSGAADKAKAAADDAAEQVVNEARRAAQEAAKSHRQYAAPSSHPSKQEEQVGRDDDDAAAAGSRKS